MKLNKLYIPAGIFLLSFIVYILTLNPSVSFTDNGELAGVAYSLGVAHSSGYPLLAILSHFWTLIPFGWTVVYQLNVLSAIFAASSTLVLFYTIRLFLNNMKTIEFITSDQKKKKKDKVVKHFTVTDSVISNTYFVDVIAISLSLTYAFSSIIWEQAVVFEVYTLQFLLINLAFYFLFSGLIYKEKRDFNFLISGLFVGLSFANHLSTVLIIPALIYVYFNIPGEKFDYNDGKFMEILLIGIFIFAGSLLYIYLPVRSSAEPDFNWGYVHRSLSKFLYHVQGKQYQIWMFSGLDTAIDNFGKFLIKIPFNLGIIGIIPFLVGFKRLYNSYRSYLGFFVILALTCILYSVNYSIHDIDVYFYLAIYSFLLITSAGLLMLIENRRKLIYLAVLLPIINFSINYADNDKSDNYLVYDYTRNVVDNLDTNAVIISAQWDYWCSAFWYLQKVENYRPDVVLIERELLRRTWYPYQLTKWYPEIVSNCNNEFHTYEKDLELFESGNDAKLYPDIQEHYIDLLRCFIESNIDERPIYVTYDFMNSGQDAEPLKDYNIIPVGFAFKLEKIQEPFKVTINNLKLERFVDFPKNSKNHLENGILEIASMNLVNIGRYAKATGDNKTAISAFNKSLEIFPENQFAKQSLLEIK